MNISKNFLPEQYRKTKKLPINHNYLLEQFDDREVIWEKIREVVIRGDFTLGSDVDLLEEEFATLSNVKHAISVGSGTDALFLSLKALGVCQGDEVITTPFTFYATIGAIATAGAKPVFCDVAEDFNINASLISNLISDNTKVILPVHWSGKCCDMAKISHVAAQHDLYVVADACHAIAATYKKIPAGALGDLACFSFHPLKNLNVWGDGGIIATNSDSLANSLRLMRNHGLVSRDICEVFAYNSRLDTIQAVIARHILSNKLDLITKTRIQNAKYYDEKLGSLSEVVIPPRESESKHVYHIYSILCEKRDELVDYLIANGVDAKIHYPTPMHLQPAARAYGYCKGDFPVAERICCHTISLPVHEFITRDEQDTVIRLIEKFYGKP